MRALFIAALLLVAAPARAEFARRFALVVGANRGDAADQRLRFAEADAERMRRVLREMGGFSAGDLVELKSPSVEELRGAMERLARYAAESAAARRPAMLLFYYSGHADQDALHVDGGHLDLTALRAWLGGFPAAVRIGILDSCRSGALTRVKGMHTAPPVEVRITDQLNAKGEALLTSSTSDEQARESDALRGSFFTHHFVSGLRGAADRSRDGRVTLAEAYEYAYGRTVAQAGGGQHPTFKYDLAGRGDVILTSLSEAGAWLDFAEGANGVYFILGEDGVLLGDVEVNGPIKVAIAPGAYEIRQMGATGERAVRVYIGKGEERWIHPQELSPVARPPSAAKGEAAPIPPASLSPSPSPPVEAERAPTPGFLPNKLVAEHERQRARDHRAIGAGLVVAGIPAFSLGTTFALYAAGAWSTGSELVPIGVANGLGGLGMFVGGSILIVDANRELRRLGRVADGETAEAVVIANERRHVLHKRRLGKTLLAVGLANLAAGAAALAVGVALGQYRVKHCYSSNCVDYSIGTPYDAWSVAGFALASGLFSLGAPLAITGGALLWSSGRQLSALDERRWHLVPQPEAPLPPITVAPTVSRDGGGLSLSLRW